MVEQKQVRIQTQTGCDLAPYIQHENQILPGAVSVYYGERHVLQPQLTGGAYYSAADGRYNELLGKRLSDPEQECQTGVPIESRAIHLISHHLRGERWEYSCLYDD